MDNFFYNNIHIKLFSNIAHQHQLITSAMSTESTLFAALPLAHADGSGRSNYFFSSASEIAEVLPFYYVSEPVFRKQERE